MLHRILFIHEVGKYGGGAKYTLDIIRSLSKSKFEFFAAIPQNTEVSKVFAFLEQNYMDFPVKNRIDILNMIRFSRIVKKYCIDMIIAGDSVAWYTGVILKMFNKNLKCLAVIHISTACTGKKFGIIKRKLIKWVDRFWTKFYDKLIFSSKFHYDIMTSENIDRDKMTIVDTWIDIDEIHSKIDNFDYKKIYHKYKKIKKDKKLIGMVARFGPGKDYKTVIDAVEHLVKKRKDCQE